MWSLHFNQSRYYSFFDQAESWSSTRHARSTHPQISFSGAASWLWHHPAHPTVIRRVARSRTRLARSGGLPDRAARLDQFQVGRDRKRKCICPTAERGKANTCTFWQLTIRTARYIVRVLNKAVTHKFWGILFFHFSFFIFHFPFVIWYLSFVIA